MVSSSSIRGGLLEEDIVELPYDPVGPLPGIYPKKMKHSLKKDYSTPMFTAPLFTIAKIWVPLSVHGWTPE